MPTKSVGMAHGIFKRIFFIMDTPLRTVDETCNLFRRATEANHQCAIRSGNVVRINNEDGEDLILGADLHGACDNFQRLCELADLEKNARRHLVMQEVCHGGDSYDEGHQGCKSHAMLEEVAALKVRYSDRFHFLLSNHELSELMDFPIIKGRQMLNLSFRNGLQQAYGERAEEVREEASQFIRSSPLAVRLANRIFISHSLPTRVEEEGFDVSVLNRPYTEDDLNEGGAAFRMVWGRDYRLENATAFAELVDADLLIHGHDPCSEGYRVPNRYQIILDSCCSHPCYLQLPVESKMTQKEVIEAIRPLS